MKYGMNLLLWSGELTEELLPVCESLKKMGYDGVEVPLFNYDLDYACLLYTSPSPRDLSTSRMPSSA